MITAVPISLDGSNPMVSDIFARSERFAIIEDDLISFETNKRKNGKDVIKWLYDKGVVNIVTAKLGKNVYEQLDELDIECFCVNHKTTLAEVIAKIHSENLQPYQLTQCVDHSIEPKYCLTH